MPCELSRWGLEWVSERLHLRRGVYRAEWRPVFGVRCWAVQNCDWYQRVRELRRWGVLQRDRRKQRERVCFMPGGDVLERFRGERVCELHRRDVFGGGGRELGGGMRELRDRDVFGGGGRELGGGVRELRDRDVFGGGGRELGGGVHELRVRDVFGGGGRELVGGMHKLPRRDIFGRWRGELVGGMRELRDRDVFDHGRCKLFDGLHQLRGRDVLERVRRDKRERVCELPGGDDFVGRGKCVCLSCEYISKSRFTLHELSAQLELVCC